MSIPRLPTSRRTAIAWALSAPLALAACDLAPPPASQSASQSTPSTESPVTPAPPPDTDVVASARAAILGMATTVEATATAHPRLRRELTTWLDLHRSHLDVLDDGSEDQTVEPALSGPIARSTAAARQDVTSAERGLALTLADAAGQASSGDLARALASMSAAVDQRVSP